MYRGSQKHVLDWVEQPLFVPELLNLVRPVGAKVTAQSVWAPLGYRWPDEARLERWGPKNWGAHKCWGELEDWWLAAPRGANTPNWDLAMIADLEGQRGLILVEAKANVPELSRDGKEPPSESEGSRANHNRIGEAIESARKGLAVVAPGLNICRNSHYQLANRLSFTWKLASLGIPVVLLYIGFTGDNGINDVGEPFSDSMHWHKVVERHLDEVGARDLFEHRQQIGGAPFWMLVRSRPVIEISPSAAI